MKKAFSLVTALCMTVMSLPAVPAANAEQLHEIPIAAEAAAWIGGYSSDQGKTNNGSRVGGTSVGAVEAYNDPAVCDGQNSKDVKVSFVRFDLGDDVSAVNGYELTLSGGSIMSNRSGDINLYVALADTESTVSDGKTPVGDSWTSFSWNDRPALVSSPETADAVVTPPEDASIDVTELLEGKTGDVTLAVIGEPASSDAAGDMIYSSVQLTALTSEWSEPEVGTEIDFTDESALEGWSAADGARFENDETVGSYAVFDGAPANEAPRTADFSPASQMIVDFDMMIPSLKADGVTQNTIGGGNTVGVALMQGTQTAGVIGFRGDSKGSPSNIISEGGTSTDYLNGVEEGKATAYFDRWMHYTVIVDTVNKSGDIFMTDPGTGIVYRHEGRFDDYIGNISSLTNIGIVSDQGYSLAVANLKVTSADATGITITAEDDMDTQYIPGEGSSSTIQYYASAYYGLTYNSNGGETTDSGETAALENTDITFSVTGNGGEETDPDKIAIDPKTGLLSVYSSAEEGDYTVTASGGSASASLTVHIKGNALAAAIQVSGDEEILSGDAESHSFTALPIAETGSVLPSKDVKWEITGEALGCSINEETGGLTVGNTAGVITVKATAEENGVSGTLKVYIRDSFDGTVKTEGVILGDGTVTFSEDNTVSEIALNSDNDYDSVTVDIKAMDKNNVTTAERTYTVNNVEAAVKTIELDEPMAIGKADKLRIKIFDGEGNIISDKTDDITGGVYKNIPLVGDWITGEKSGLGMGAGIMSPTGAPAGVDPDTVDLENSISYSNDENAPEPAADNVLWYRQGAYEKGVSIYARDGSDWEEQALPIGNGYMAGMLFGMPHKDQIQINEETFWAAGYRGTQTAVTPSTVNPNMSEGINGYMSVGNIFVDFYDMPRDAEVTDYYRDLNLDESVAHVQYKYDGATYNR